MNGHRRLMSRAKTRFAQEMRRNPTEPEAALWARLRNKQVGARFRQQAPILGYIADFYCPAKRLVIEIDGRLHDPAKDAIRDANLLRRGFRTVRIPARLVYRDIDRAVDMVCFALGGAA